MAAFSMAARISEILSLPAIKQIWQLSSRNPFYSLELFERISHMVSITNLPKKNLMMLVDKQMLCNLSKIKMFSLRDTKLS